MNTLLDAIFKRKLTVLLILGLCMVWGLVAYLTIPKESTPDVKIPIIYVSVVHEGVSPEDAERILVRPIEQKLKSIDGVKEMRSTCFEGGANVILEFNAGFDSSKARLDVREKVDSAKSDLPKDLKDPTVHEINLSLFPVLVVKLSGEIPQRTLYRLAKDLKNRIESNVPNVLKAEIVGDRKEVVEILLDPAKVQSYGLHFEKIAQTFMRNNQLVSAGNLDSGLGRFPIKVPGVFEDIPDIYSVPIANQGDAIVRLQDIADVRRTFRDPEGFARDRGRNAVALEISKRTGTNLIETVAQVRTLVENEKLGWPNHVIVDYAQDQSHNIFDMLLELQNSIILAIILVMAVMIKSLGWRSALLVGISLPGSFLTGIMALSLLGYTINMVVLFSLIFAVGMLVDGAIIVVEYADRRMAEGVPPYIAFLEASKRMTWPVISSIATILVVFFPLLVWPGVTGEFMKYLPITLILVLSASLLMALVFVPVIGSMLSPLSKPHASHETILATEKGNMDDIDGWTGVYITLLKRGLKNPGKVIAYAVLILFSVKTLHGFWGQGIEFFPKVEPDNMAIWVHARGSQSMSEKNEIVRSVESKILDMGELKSIYTRTGGMSNGGDMPEDVIGTITLEMVDWQKRRKADEIIEDILNRTKELAGIKVEVVKEQGGPPNLKPIKLQISSTNPKDLAKAVQKVRNLFESTKGLGGIQDDLPLPGVQWLTEVDRGLANKYGADILSVGNTIKLITNGAEVGKYRPHDSNDELDIIVRYLPKYRNIEMLHNLHVVTLEGAIPLSNFIKIKPAPKIGYVYRVDGQRVHTIQADVEPGILVADKIQELREKLTKLDLPQGTQTLFKGEEKDREETGSFLLKAFGIAIFLIVIILVTQFNSFFSTALVLSAVVMSTMGVFIGLIIHQLPFGIVMGGIGVIALAGIIVSNNIILIDTYDHMVQGLSQPTYEQLKEAIVRTCAQRLRPVILTKLTAILGLLPIMFGINIDFIHLTVTKGAPSSQWWVLLSMCIVYGLLFASSMTLFVTPAVLLARVNRRFGIKTFSPNLLWEKSTSAKVVGAKAILQRVYNQIRQRINK